MPWVLGLRHPGGHVEVDPARVDRRQVGLLLWRGDQPRLRRLHRRRCRSGLLLLRRCRCWVCSWTMGTRGGSADSVKQVREPGKGGSLAAAAAPPRSSQSAPLRCSPDAAAKPHANARTSAHSTRRRDMWKLFRK